MMLAAGPSLLVGCIPIDVPVGDGEDGQGWWSASVSYRLAAPVWETPVSGEREYHEAWLLDVLIDSGGQLVPAGWEYQGGAQGGSWSTGVEIQLNDSRETVTSLTAIRVKYSGVEGEWRREDRVYAASIPLVPEESSEGYLVYRLAGPAACAAISSLYFHTHRHPTEAVPEDGPDYLIADTSGAICDENSYLEVVLAYWED